MADERTDHDIERRARRLHEVHATGQGLERDDRRGLWERLTEIQQEGWMYLARSVRHAIHHEDSISGGWPTASQVDTIRELRKEYENRAGLTEQSWIGTTRPYGEMVLIFEWVSEGKVEGRIRHAWMIHPDGYKEELHKESVPQGPYVTKTEAKP